MENDYHEPDATNEASADQMENAEGVEYVAPAQVIDVLFEQLEYLATHLRKTEECPTACRVCARLDLVSRFLLSPFRDPLNRA
jgi:hypothetical protein